MPSSTCDPKVLPQTVMPSVRFTSKPHARNCQNNGYRSNFPIKAYIYIWTPGKDLSLSLESLKNIHIREHLELGFFSYVGYANEKSIE